MQPRERSEKEEQDLFALGSIRSHCRPSNPASLKPTFFMDDWLG